MSRATYLRTLKAVFRWARRQGWLELGFDLLEVSRLLGHQSVTTTERWYAGISPGRLARRFDLVDAAEEALRAGEVLPFRSPRPNGQAR